MLFIRKFKYQKNINEQILYVKHVNWLQQSLFLETTKEDEVNFNYKNKDLKLESWRLSDIVV